MTTHPLRESAPVVEKTSWTEVTVKTLILDPRSESPVVFLESLDETLVLPIWIGIFEATAIVLALEKHTLPRPMTHDLLASVIRALGTPLKCVRIHSMRDGTFFGALEFQRDRNLFHVDSRPSDAIAAAVRLKVPIFVRTDLCESSETIEEFFRDIRDEQYRQLLEKVDPKAVSKYVM
ncbi:MAG: bifunctional nuclease family protein [Candidatus Hydrogenedentota bacterium]|nr:MAG: bifunctional nuclease family protein [Candidatus Hydrogenedentota bacterium]